MHRTHRLPDAGTGQEGYDHRSGRIGEEPPGPDFGVNVSAKMYRRGGGLSDSKSRDPTNRAEVLRGWCDLREQRGANPRLEEKLRELPYQMVHRAASACHQRNASSCWLVYLVFEATAKKRSEYLADLTQLRDVLGSRSSLGIALAGCSIEQSPFLIELRRRWDDGERHFHVPVLQRLKSGGCDGGASESRQPERTSGPDMEEARTPKSVDRDLGL